jgi:hypothetical protein
MKRNEYYALLDRMMEEHKYDGFMIAPTIDGRAFIGFIDMDEVEQFAQQYGLEVHLYTRQNGRKVYEDRGVFCGKGLDAKDFYKSDSFDYEVLDETAEEYFQRNIGFVTELDNVSQAQEYIEKMKRVSDALEMRASHEVVITFEEDYLETDTRYAVSRMDTHDSGTLYIIGVGLNAFDPEDEEPDEE